MWYRVLETLVPSLLSIYSGEDWTQLLELVWSCEVLSSSHPFLLMHFQLSTPYNYTKRLSNIDVSDCCVIWIPKTLTPPNPHRKHTMPLIVMICLINATHGPKVAPAVSPSWSLPFPLRSSQSLPSSAPSIQSHCPASPRTFPSLALTLPGLRAGDRF